MHVSISIHSIHTGIHIKYVYMILVDIWQCGYMWHTWQRPRSVEIKCCICGFLDRFKSYRQHTHQLSSAPSFLDIRYIYHNRCTCKHGNIWYMYQQWKQMMTHPYSSIQTCILYLHMHEYNYVLIIALDSKFKFQPPCFNRTKCFQKLTNHR